MGKCTGRQATSPAPFEVATSSIKQRRQSPFMSSRNDCGKKRIEKKEIVLPDWLKKLNVFLGKLPGNKIAIITYMLIGNLGETY